MSPSWRVACAGAALLGHTWSVDAQAVECTTDPGSYDLLGRMKSGRVRVFGRDRPKCMWEVASADTVPAGVMGTSALLTDVPLPVALWLAIGDLTVASGTGTTSDGTELSIANGETSWSATTGASRAVAIRTYSDRLSCSVSTRRYANTEMWRPASALQGSAEVRQIEADLWTMGSFGLEYRIHEGHTSVRAWLEFSRDRRGDQLIMARAVQCDVVGWSPGEPIPGVGWDTTEVQDHRMVRVAHDDGVE